MTSVHFKVPSSRPKADNDEIIIDLEKFVKRFDFFLHATLEAVNQTASWKDTPLASVTDDEIVEYVRQAAQREKKASRPLFKGKFDADRVREWINIFKEKKVIVPA